MWSNRIRVIFADDGALMRHLFQEAFEKHDRLEIAGYAKTAREVIGLCEARSPHVILIDEDLYGIPGSQIVSNLRELNQDVAIVGLVSPTTKGRSEGDEMITCGANSYLQKPITTGHPREAIRKYQECVLPEIIIRGGQIQNVGQPD